MSASLLQFVVLLGVMAALVVPVGNWLYGVATGQKDTALERLTYRVIGINPREIGRAHV